MNLYQRAGTQYHAWGANVTAIQAGTKKPLNKWEKWFVARQTAQDAEKLAWGGLPEWKEKGLPARECSGVGFISGGDVCGYWRDIDFDGCPDWAPVGTFLQKLGLPESYPWAYRTGNGYHIEIRCEDDIPEGVIPTKGKNEPGVYWGISKAGDFDHLELRWHSCQTLLPPSQHPDGPLYQWRGEAPTEPPAMVSIGDVLTAFYSVASPKAVESPQKQTRAQKRESATAPAEHSATLETLIDQVKRDFDMVAYAHKNMGGEVYQDGKEWRALGNGGLLIDPERGQWNCFADGKGETGGGPLQLVAYHLFGDHTRAKGRDFWEVLEEAAGFAGVTIPDEVRGQPETTEESTRCVVESPPRVTAEERLSIAPFDLVRECVYQEEWGDARLLSYLYKGRLVYDHTEKVWCCWAGNIWRKDTTGLVRQIVAGQVASQYLHAAATVNQMAAAEADPDKKGELLALYQALSARPRKLRSLNRTKNVLGFAESLLGITGEEWDSDPWLLGVRNGVLNLRSGELRPGQPDDYIRTAAPTEWRGLHEPAPRFEHFLEEIFEDVPGRGDLLGYLFRLFGYGITGLSTEHVLPIFWGENGRNGKDTLLSVFERVLGPLAGPVSNDVLIAQDRVRGAGSATPHLMSLRGKRLAWASETNEGARLEVAQVKYLTGGGTITGRFLHQNQVTFTPTHLMLLITNHKPHIPPDESATWERVQLVPFNMRFVDNPQSPNERAKDSSLKLTLRAEASGVLAWLVRGCLAWQRQGLGVPEVVKMATAAYQDEEDTLGLFFEEYCQVAPGCTVKAQTLFDAYGQWVEAMGLRSKMSQITFGKKVAKRFAKERTKTGYHYQGIGLLSESTMPLPVEVEEPAVNNIAAGEQYEQFCKKSLRENSSRKEKTCEKVHIVHQEKNGSPTHTNGCQSEGEQGQLLPQKPALPLSPQKSRGEGFPAWLPEWGEGPTQEDEREAERAYSNATHHDYKKARQAAGAIKCKSWRGAIVGWVNDYEADHDAARRKRGGRGAA